MLTHYRELLRYYRGTILMSSLVAGAVAMALSLVLLKAMPIYQASVVVNMEPSTEELTFNRGFMGVSQFNPATIIAQTHVENILSRPVAERAIDILVSQNGGDLPASPASAFSRFRAAFYRSIRILNSGYFVPLSPKDIYVNDLMSATKIEIVEGSYILLISISYSDPVIAAQAANALAAAYLDVRQDEFTKDASLVDETLTQLRAETEATLEELIQRRRQIAAEVGVTNVGAERTYLLENRSSSRTALQEAEIELLHLNSELDELQLAIARESDANITRQLRQNLVQVRSEIAAAETRLERRQANWTEAVEALRKLDIVEEAFLEIDQRVAETRSELDELQQREVQIQLARRARLSQVRIIAEAQAPLYPKFPKVMLNTIVGLIVGGILALVPISALDVLGDRIRTSADLRSSFGSNTLPAFTPSLRRQVRKFLRTRRKPSKALQRYATAIGRKLSSEGSQRWPENTLFVTSLGTEKNCDDLADLMKAVVYILDRQRSDGTLIAIETLPPISRISDWKSFNSLHTIIGIRPGVDLRADIESISKNMSDKSPVFSILLS